MKFTANTTNGSWLDKKALRTGDLLKLVSEAKEIPSQQEGKMQVVAKCKVKGQDGEPKNIAINKPSVNALIEAFGDDSVKWIDKLLTVHIEKTLIAGKRGIGLYLLPEGYQVEEDEGGYLIVSKPGLKTVNVPSDGIDYPQDINPDDIPF